MISKSLILGSVVLLSMSFKCGHSTNCEAYGGMQEKSIQSIVKQKLSQSTNSVADKTELKATRKK